MTAKASKTNIWDAPPWPRRGDQSQDKLYASIGRAISEWERYESVLGFLFENLVGDTPCIAARRAYGAVRTFEGRSDMLRAASEAFFYATPDGILKDKTQTAFKEVLRYAIEFSKRRNEIVHGVVDHFQKEPPVPKRIPAGSTYALFPAYVTFKPRTIEGLPAYCYTSKELEHFRREFLKLKHPVHLLCGEVVTLLAYRRASSRHKLR